MSHHRLIRYGLTTSLVAWQIVCGGLLHAGTDAVRVLPAGQVPQDRRLGPLKDLNGYFPFRVPASVEAWRQRATVLRRQILVATGLWPLPERTPLNAVIHGRTLRDGFTVEKVFFESVPNHFVTGLLFRPRDKTGRRPAVLCPHGHGGRLQDYGPKKIRELIVQGAERFEGSGRFPKLARCAQLARMGCVVFIYDMIGYADSVQIPRALAHGFSKQRPDFEGSESWGLFSTQAELRLQNIMGLQTWNSIRALDWLCSLPDVDPARIGVTGGSGGGTQTILLCAIDPRPVVAFPQGMVSTAMQGGCTCENCCLLRVGTGNVELAALFAPKPLGMTAANDWTKEMMQKGYPQLGRLYGMLGAKDHVFCKPLLHFHHNYNYVTRAIMYGWMNRYLGLGLEEPIVEEDFRPLTPAERTVWDQDHPRPAGGPDYERSLTRYLADQSERQIDALVPSDGESLVTYRQIVGAAFQTIFGRSLADVGTIRTEAVAHEKRGPFVEHRLLLDVVDHGEQLPVIRIDPAETAGQPSVVVWVDGAGKKAIYQDESNLRPGVRRLLDAGKSVVAADLLYQGEFLRDGQPIKQTRVVENPREFAGYTFAYNPTLFAHRVHDLMAVVSWLRSTLGPGAEIDMMGLNGAGPVVAAARAEVGPVVDRAAIDTAGFRFRNLTSYRDINFLPGAVKYGDLPALLALGAPSQLWLAGEGGQPPRVTAAAYRAAELPGRIVSSNVPRQHVPHAAVEWLLRPPATPSNH